MVDAYQKTKSLQMVAQNLIKVGVSSFGKETASRAYDGIETQKVSFHSGLYYYYY